MLNIPFTANWKFIEERKRLLINKNNKRENSKRTPHTYKVGDQVLIKKAPETKYGKNPAYKGPYPVTAVRGDTVTIDEGKVVEFYNIRNVKPYYS